jgi:uncharacterized protein YceK
VAVEIRLKKGARMRKIFAGFLMTVMLLSGCGAVKNLENPGLSEIAKPKFGGDTYVPAEGQFWAKWGADIYAATAITVIVGLLAICNHFYDFSSISAKKTSKSASENAGLAGGHEGVPTGAVI